MRICHRSAISSKETLAISAALPIALSAIYFGSHSLCRRALMLKSEAIGAVSFGSATVGAIVARLLFKRATSSENEAPLPTPTELPSPQHGEDSPPTVTELPSPQHGEDPLPAGTEPPPAKPEEPPAEVDSDEDDFADALEPPFIIPMDIARQMVRRSNNTVYIPVFLKNREVGMWESAWPLTQQSFDQLKSHFPESFQV